MWGLSTAFRQGFRTIFRVARGVRFCRQRTVKVSIFVPQGVRTPRFEAGRPVEWLEIPRGWPLKDSTSEAF